MGLIDNVKAPRNEIETVAYDLLVSKLFRPLDVVSSEDLGVFPNVTAKKNYVIEHFIKEWRQFVGPDIYPAARLIFPNRDRRLYYIRDLNLARIVIKILQIPKKSSDHDKLLHYKEHYHQFRQLNRYGQKQLRSLPLIISHIIAERRDPSYVVKPSITINKINDVLDKLSQPESTNVKTQVEILKPVVNQLTIEEVRWFFMVILKQSILGRFEVVFFKMWHPDAPRLYNVCSSLPKVLWLLHDPEYRLNEEQLKVQPMYPFPPQLSQKLTISYSALCANMNHDFIVEEKMDGDRMILHMENNKFKFFSRRIRDYSLLYGTNLQIGSLTKYLGNAFHPKVRSIVLDGEMVAWDFKRNVILPFGTLKSAAIQEAVRQFTTTDIFAMQSSYPLFFVFDILHLNGKDLTEYALADRKSLLHQLINPVPHKFEILPYRRCKDPVDIQNALKEVISDRNEGIMVKNAALRYHVATRHNCWIKVKPEYLEEFGENVDLAVIGVIPGIKNAYMCGLRDDYDNGCFRSFCTVGNGFSDYEYSQIQRITEGKWHNFLKDPPPPQLLKFGSRKPVSWIDPKDSVVLEIKARSIDNNHSETYSVGTTLHNLYCRSIRKDKLYDECITLDEYLELKQKYSSTTNKEQTVARKRRRLLDSFEQQFTKKKLRKRDMKTGLFKNYVFLVASDCFLPHSNTRFTKEQIKQQVQQHGGGITLNPYVTHSHETIVLISDRLTPKCKQYVLKNLTILRYKWIADSVEQGRPIPVEPSHVLASRDAAVLAAAQTRVDAYGDSYILPVSEPIQVYADGLRAPSLLSRQRLMALKHDFVSDLSAHGVTAPLSFLFDNIPFLIVTLGLNHWSISGLMTKIKTYMGTITTDLFGCSFVVVPNFMADDMRLRGKLLEEVGACSWRLSEHVNFSDGQSTPIPRIVTETFVDVSIAHGELPDAQDYLFR